MMAVVWLENHRTIMGKSQSLLTGINILSATFTAIHPVLPTGLLTVYDFCNNRKASAE